ncbi:MAG: heme-binding protein [Planctomycetes bacterium]|nr:heme-binding protein [Planctomycetota bacterium]
MSRLVKIAAVAVVVTVSVGLFVAAKAPAPSLSADEITKILDNAETDAKKEESLLRVNAEGKKQPTRMHIVVVDRGGRLVGQRSMADAWVGSIAIAKSKAFTALCFSSNENALTTRTIGALTQPGGPLWNIGNSNRQDGLIEFPGGVPLYRNGELVGGIGVSGDGVDQDERVAVAGAKGYEAPKAIRADTVAGAPYTK